MNETGLTRAFAPMRLLACLADEQPAATLAATVLLADLANFTGLTEALAAKAGTDGGEFVGRDLNQALGPVIDAVMRHGGEVVKFTGDGLLCVFPAADGAPDASARAAAEIAAVAVRGPNGQAHQFRIAVTHGPVVLTRLGGHRGRHELVAGGAAVERAQEMVTRAWPGTPGLVLRLQPPQASQSPLTAHPADAAAYLPEYVRARLAERRSAWLQELRTLTILFAAVDAAPTAVAMQAAALAMQVAVDGHGGQLLRFSLEGRSLVAEVAFGLAVGAAATGPPEALQCACALRAAVAGVRIGISTGRVLLGPIGSDARRQLTSLGTAVNLAARLMQRAAGGEALADEAAWAGGQGRCSGTPALGELKGLGERGFWRLDAVVPAAAASNEEFFGREGQVQALRELLARAAAPVRPVVVQGEAGIGKSRLCRWLVQELGTRGITPSMAVATPVGRDTPYAGLAAALATLCGLQPGTDPGPGLQALAAQLLGSAGRAPLLADALGLQLADTPETRGLGGRVRAENIRETLTALLRHHERAGPAVLIVEDAHWLDSASWALLQRLAAEAVALRIVVFMRPMPGLEPPELWALRARAELDLNLGSLSVPDIARVMASRLGADEVPGGLVQWVSERARGNPLFARELVAMLVALGHVEVQGGVVTRMPGAAELRALPPIDTIESAIEQRIDRLGVEDAVVLKVASVIGPSFGLDALGHAVSQAAGGGIDAVLRRLVAADMAVPQGPGRFAFRHRYTQEAAYRMLPGARRRDLHARVAGWFEGRFGERADEHAGELAHHWFAAEDRPKAVQWLERAGAQALRTGADREAATHFRRALSIDDAQPAGRRAAWRRQLARAMFGLGEVEGVAQEARAAIELVARPLPTRALHWAWFAGSTALGRLFGRRPATRSQAVEDLLEGARAAGLLAESAYFLNAPETMVGSALLAVGLAERTPSAAPVSVAYGMLGVVAGMARMHGAARRNLGRARALSEAADDAYQLGVAWFYTGMYHGCRGDWAASFDAAQRALALTEALGADMQSGFQLTLIATNALYTSEYGNTRAWMETVRSRAEGAANVQQLGWACNVVSVADLHQGRHADAVARSEQARQIFLGERDLVSLIIAEGVQCAALAHSGRMPEALVGAARATALIASARPTTWGQLEGFAGPCEVLGLALAQGCVTAVQARQRVQTALAGLRLFAWVFPFGRARHQWICGLLAGAAGRPRAARWHLRRAIVLARRFGMPYEELRATVLLAELEAKAPAVELHRHAARLKALVDGPVAAQGEVQAV